MVDSDQIHTTPSARLTTGGRFRRIFRSAGSWLRRKLAPGALVIAVLMSMGAAAQAAPDPTGGVDQDQPRQIEIISENDLYGSGTDRYYTAGQRIIIDLKDDDARWLNKGFDALGFDNPDRRVASLTQSIFTPDDITRADHPKGSHPWAGFLGATAGASQDRGNGARDSVEFTIGVTGPISLAEKSQKFIHNTFDMTYPAGWDNQLSNEPHVNLTYGRHWPGKGQWDVGGFKLKASPYVLGTVGTWETSATGGTILSIGSDDEVRTTRPAQVMPGRSNLGPEPRSTKDHGWNLYIGGEAKAVGRNTAIDGNFWRNGPDAANSNAAVAEGYVGAQYRYKDVRVGFELVHRSKEFKQQTGDHQYGRIGVSWKF